MFKNLFRYDYKDESKFPWAFAVVIDKIRNTVTITKMMAASSIKESKDRILQAILEFHKRLMAIRRQSARRSSTLSSKSSSAHITLISKTPSTLW